MNSNENMSYLLNKNVVNVCQYHVTGQWFVSGLNRLMLKCQYHVTGQWFVSGLNRLMLKCRYHVAVSMVSSPMNTTATI